MIEEFIYDISLECHAALTTLIQKGNLWKGPICFDDIFNTFRLLYTNVPREITDKLEDKRFLKIRYKRDYSGEENMWGMIEAYKRLLCLIVFNQCDLNADIISAVENFKSVLKDFKSTLASGLLVIIIHNELKEAIPFSNISLINPEIVDRIQELTVDLPSFCEIVLLPGNGFLNEQSSMREYVINGNGSSDSPRYYRFSRLLDGIVHDTLLREVRYLTLSIEAFQNGHDRRAKPMLFPPPEDSVPQRNGSCISFYGKVSAAIHGVSIDELMKPSEHAELSVSFQTLLGWGSQTDSPLIVQPTIAMTGKVFDAHLPKVSSLPEPTYLELPTPPQPKRWDRAIYDSFVWGTENKLPYPSRQYLCRRNKLAGDIYVQLGEFEKAQFYYQRALRYYVRNDPAIWQSTLLVGYSASIHLREVDLLVRQRYFDPHLLSRPQSMFLSSTISSSDCVNGLDLADVKKLDSKFPRNPSFAMFRAGQAIQHLKRAASLPRCVIEVMYKNADYLVTASKKSSAIRAIDSLQKEVIPRGNAFTFERYRVLSNLYERLGLLHKAGLLHYLLENSLFSLIHTSYPRPPAALTHSSASYHAYINRISSGYLGSPTIISAYQLSTTPAGFRRTPDGNSIGVVFICGLVFSASGQLGWPMLQRQILVSVINKIRAAIEQTSGTIRGANWVHCTSLIGYMFSLINGWHEHAAPADIPAYIEILQHLAATKPADQPSLTGTGGTFHDEKGGASSATRSSFGSPVSSKLHPLVKLVELHVDKMPVVRSITIPRLPPHSLPSRMSYEALSSMVAVQNTSHNSPSRSGSNAYSKRKTFSRQPTFITHPFHMSSSDTVDWVASDLGYIEVVFENPFSIQLVLDEVSFELIEEEPTTESQVIKLESVQIIPSLKSPAREITLKPFSGCIFEQVSLFLNGGNDPDSGSYVKKVVLSPRSIKNRFLFAVSVPFALAELKTEKWRVRAISYRLVTFGGFRVSLPLADGEDTAKWKVYTSPQAALEEDEVNVKIVNMTNGLDRPPPIRICPPLPRLCLLAGPCTNEKEKIDLEPDSILDKMSASAHSYAPSLRLASTLNNQETKQSVCNIIIDLHPYERRWFPIRLFVGANACSKATVQQPSIDCGKQLNLLHISLQTPLSTNKFLQKYDLLLGQFLQIPNVMDVRQKLPVKLISIPSTRHCRLKDDPSTSGSCGTLWIQADSSAFWDAWYQDPASTTQFLGKQSLQAQLCIELAADVPMAMSAEENWTRMVIGKSVKVGIEIRFLNSVHSPLRIVEPTLEQNPNANKGSSVDCILRLKMNKVLTPELTNLPRPTPECSDYRTELDISFSWAKQTFNFDGRKFISVDTEWQTFGPPPPERNGSDNKRVDVSSDISGGGILSGLVKVDETRFKNAPDTLGLPLFNLLQIFQLAELPPLAVATRPTDELLLPLPLPHALGRLVEHGIDIRWTAGLVVKVNGQKYRLPNVRSGRIVPILPLSSSDAAPWYFPLLRHPRFIASILWRSRIWLQLVQRFHSTLPVYRMEDCPACKEAAAIKDPTPQFVNRNRRPIDASATHVIISPLSKMPLELFGGIEDDEFFSSLYNLLVRQFSPFVDPSKRECVDLSEQRNSYESESALMENLKDGLVLHRLWIGLDVFEADGNCKTVSSTKPLAEGTAFSLCGCLRGQAGLFVGKPMSTDDVFEEPKTPFGCASTQSLKGSVVFMRTGNFFVRGFVHLLPLPFSDASDRFIGLEFKRPPTHLFFGPIQETSHSFLFHVRD